MDVATFRAVYTGFADPVKYPDTAVQYWLDDGVARLPALTWTNLLDEGLGLFTAHRLALGAMYALNPAGGLVSSKSVGGVSIAYNYEVGMVANAGAYNLTVYGREFIQLATLVGMGGYQL